MADAATSSSSGQTKEKPVVVRIKRKVSHSILDSLWLEINERPVKKQFLNFEGLSIDESSSKLEEFGKKKLLLQHLGTVAQCESIKDVLHSFLQHDSTESKELKGSDKHRSLFKPEKNQEQRRAVSRKQHEDHIRSARFEQIWKNRRASMGVEEDSLQEICHLYDVVRVDAEDDDKKAQKPKSTPVDDSAILCNYLPLIREFLPEVASDIEQDLSEDKYVYDLYAVDDCVDADMEDPAGFPLVKVDDDDDDYYDGPLWSEFESDDSNAEDNPRNDYPEEEPSGEDDARDPFDEFEGSDSEYEDEEVNVDDDNEQDWRWGHR